MSPKTRQCCLTRQNWPVSELVRFAVGPDGTLVPDIDSRAGGRGAWVHADRASVERAVAKKAFARALKLPLNVPSDLAQMTAARLEQRLLGALGLARKAGQIVLGATKVEKAITAATIVALITASDGRPDGRRKMIGALRAAGLADVPRYGLLSSDQLSLALGHENVIHAALTGGAAANSVIRCLKRYLDFVQDRRDVQDHREEKDHELAHEFATEQNQAGSHVKISDREVAS